MAMPPRTKGLISLQLHVVTAMIIILCLFLQEYGLSFPRNSGADPEILHGRWLIGWLLIVNYTGVREVAD